MAIVTKHPPLDLTRIFGERARDLTERMVSALRGALPVEEVWLFGSCARGDAVHDSDLDVLVVLADDHGLARPTLACYRAIRRLHTGIPTDVMTIARSRWEREQAEPFGLFGDARREGVRLYANGRKESPALV
ncbi:MAG TPA: nucleotidyltransferase domain-containing protein [Verrucomicrobiae bacterium]|jgi:predicted nucleotidyltransferase